VTVVCGIGGIWSGTGRRISEPGRIARLFGDALAHRGPDGEGFLGIQADSGIAKPLTTRDAVDAERELCGLLVHRRLSIIDLATGDQPMTIANNDPWVIYNGEIYNYPELKEELEAFGTPFRTTSDTEVILHVYARWGVSGFRRLNGIFAFALYDVKRREVILARDPIGVKPLYWSAGTFGVAFASEIRPLLAGGFADREVGADRLAQFLFYRFVPAPGTVWRDVNKVVPGHALRFGSQGRLLADTDFAAPAPEQRTVSWNEIADTLAPHFVRTVQRQMLSDVPVGAFLSGGLDSSLVLSALGEKAAGMQTFAVGFPDEPGLPSELSLAQRAATHLRSSHTGMQLEPQGYFDRLPWAIEQVEEPLAHPGMLLQSDLSALARQRVKVVLTGQGADEPLGGYPRHHAARVLPWFAGVLGGLARSSWITALAARRELMARIQRVLSAPAGLERAAALFSPLAPEMAGAMARGCGPENGRAAVLGAIQSWWNRSEGLDTMARILYIDVRTSLAEDLLLVADKMGMAHSLEVRVPFLDLEYLAVVESIPGSQRVGVMRSRKRVQRELGRRLLPSSLFKNLAGSTSPLRKKRGFDVPVSSWFRGPMRERLPEFLIGSSSVLPALVNRESVSRSVRAFLNGTGDAYRQVFALFVLEHWLRANLAQR